MHKTLPTIGAVTVDGEASSPDDGMKAGLLAAAHDNLFPMVWMTFVAAAGLTAILVSNGMSWAGWWFAVVAALSCLRFIAGRLVTREELLGPRTAAVRRWYLATVAGLVASSTVWAILAVLTLGAGGGVTYLLAITLSALAAGGTGILAPLVWPARYYIATMLIPGSLLMFERSGTGLVMAMLGVAFFVIMCVVHNRNHAILKNSIRLSLDNRALVDELKLLNHDLEGDVAKRTRQLMAAANTDALTGLPNRRRLVEWMDLELDPRGGEAAAVLFLDLDRFKQINDALGHATGDRVLCEAVNRLRERLPRGAILARWGGDEFIIVLKDRTEAAEKARELGEELIAAISRPFEVDEQTVYPGLSVGVALFPDHADGHKALLLAADLAVAEAKRSGRGRVVCYEPSFSKVQMRRYDLSRALSGAIERGELSLHYQPIVTGKDFQLHGFEALARWSQPDLGEIDPAEFIPIAEETDCIHALGYWALRTACAEAALWQDERRGARVAVNVSVKQLAAHDFALRLAQVLTQTGLAPGRLELEVTESVFADDSQSDDRARTIGSLRALGVKLAIDDFGTGYSSLSRLINMPVSSVKIDRTFVSELDGSGVAVVESTIMIARRLGISVVAEGIENAAQAEALAALGVDYFQGYHFGRPAPSVEAVGRSGMEGSRRTPFAGLSVAG